LQYLTKRLTGLAGNKFLTKNLFSTIFQDENFYTFLIKNVLLFFMTFLIG